MYASQRRKKRLRPEHKDELFSLTPPDLSMRRLQVTVKKGQVGAEPLCLAHASCTSRPLGLFIVSLSLHYSNSWSHVSLTESYVMYMRRHLPTYHYQFKHLTLRFLWFLAYVFLASGASLTRLRSFLKDVYSTTVLNGNTPTVNIISLWFMKTLTCLFGSFKALKHISLENTTYMKTETNLKWKLFKLYCYNWLLLARFQQSPLTIWYSFSRFHISFVSLKRIQGEQSEKEEVEQPDLEI